jgi:hypothetical protein
MQQAESSRMERIGPRPRRPRRTNSQPHGPLIWHIISCTTGRGIPKHGRSDSSATGVIQPSGSLRHGQCGDEPSEARDRSCTNHGSPHVAEPASTVVKTSLTFRAVVGH